MTSVPDSYGNFWNYLSKNQQDLLLEGNYLVNELLREPKYEFKDYSFLVFPYAKSFEGYMKQVCYDVGFISRLDYISDHLRLGKLMSPNLVGKLGDHSLYKKIKEATTKELADRVWDTWRNGRNQIFHYFPHNVKAISLEESHVLINNMLRTMEEVYRNIYEPYHRVSLDNRKTEKKATKLVEQKPPVIDEKVLEQITPEKEMLTKLQKFF